MLGFDQWVKCDVCIICSYNSNISYNFMNVYLFSHVCVHLYFVLETTVTKDKAKPSPGKKGNDFRKK